MNENIKKLIEEISKNEELQQEFSKCTSPEEAYKLATSYVDGYTSEEFVSTMTKMNEVYEKYKDSEITDDDLEKAAGGKDSSEIVDVLTVATFSVAASVTIPISCLAPAAVAAI